MGAENLCHLGICRTERGRSRLSVRHQLPGRSWSVRRWNDLRLVDLKLIFLVVSRAMLLIRLSHREPWWKDARSSCCATSSLWPSASGLDGKQAGTGAEPAAAAVKHGPVREDPRSLSRTGPVPFRRRRRFRRLIRLPTRRWPARRRDRRSGVWVPNVVSLCDLGILADQAAEPDPAQYPGHLRS